MPPAAQQHPVYRMVATNGITKGQPIKAHLSATMVALLAECLGPACAAAGLPFDAARFQKEAAHGLDSLELKARSAQIACAMTAQLCGPGVPLEVSLTAFERCLGPTGSEQRAGGTLIEGLANFFYYPHSSFLETIARDVAAKDVAAGPAAALDRLLESNVCLTKRFTAEFSVRPLIERWPTETLSRMATNMIRDVDADVRRLVSEGTRPRLPWGSHLTLFRKDPTPCLPLLDALKWDTELYVRRSVANHVGDILKDNFDVGLRVCTRWVDLALDGHSAVAEMARRATGAPPEILPLSVVLPRPATKAGKKTPARAKASEKSQKAVPPQPSPGALKAVQEELLWVVRHALRNPDKNGNKLAAALRQRAHVPKS